MRPTKEDCGCRSNEREWLELCQAHRAEHDERHARALEDKRRAELIGYYHED
jgi:hypothetical protein